MAAAKGDVSSSEDEVEEKEVGGVPEMVRVLFCLVEPRVEVGVEEASLEVEPCLEEEWDLFFLEEEMDELLEDRSYLSRGFFSLSLGSIRLLDLLLLLLLDEDSFLEEDLCDRSLLDFLEELFTDSAPPPLVPATELLLLWIFFSNPDEVLAEEEECLL